MTTIKGITALLILLCASGGSAEIVLRFDPTDQRVPLGEMGSLSVMLDDAIGVRTIELRVTYLPEVLQSIGGVPGQLLEDSGCMVFDDFDDSVPGEWYGGAVIIGYDCWGTGPGELFRWNFSGIAEGVSGIEAVMVRLYPPQGDAYEDVLILPTTVRVGEETAAPAAPLPDALALFPNPFNARTRIHFRGDGLGPAQLDVFDPTGRHLARLWDGQLEAGALTVDWDARDSGGRTLPNGVYLLRLARADGRWLMERAVLIK